MCIRDSGNNNNKRDKRTDAAIHAMVLEPIGDRGHHKSNDGADGKKLNNRCQDAHKVKAVSYTHLVQRKRDHSDYRDS